MAFVFQPSLYRGGVLYPLPRPIPVVRVREEWDFLTTKVPLAEGDVLYGHSRKGAEIVIEGQTGAQDGTITVGEEEMFGQLELLHQAVHVSTTQAKFEFLLYCDAVTEVYRKFKGCSTKSFEYDLSDSALFSYRLVLHAEDPEIYETGPGG